MTPAHLDECSALNDLNCIVKGKSCDPNPCHNNGFCIQQENVFKCICKNSYFGRTCEENLCTPNPCENGGKCSIGRDRINCTCVYPYSGDMCESGSRAMITETFETLTFNLTILAESSIRRLSQNMVAISVADHGHQITVFPYFSAMSPSSFSDVYVETKANSFNQTISCMHTAIILDGEM
ncbi:hypothetical protein TNCV_2336361 [Trichonephila clavipes]|uniref:EGF-like domain-containing protein n=1 Tax=Trichonephila clavipes TaxID=2585209 RepID=A0A8X6VCK1_TRICX|nr:hypothetical protein TNCV_2336361 [Trichonephila clavipes]